MSKSVNVDFVTRQIEVDTDGKEYYVSAAMAAKDAEQSMLNAQNAANTAEKIASDLGLVDEAVQTAVASATTASNKADIATAKADIATNKANEADVAATTATSKADAASISATNAAQSYADADAIAGQLTEYLNTKEELTAPAVDKTLLIEGAAADAKFVGEIKSELANISPVNLNFQKLNVIALEKYLNAEVQYNKSLTGYNTSSFTPDIDDGSDIVVTMVTATMESKGITGFTWPKASSSQAFVGYTEGVEAFNSRQPPTTYDKPSQYLDKICITLPFDKPYIYVKANLEDVTESKDITNWIDASDLKDSTVREIATCASSNYLKNVIIDGFYGGELDGSVIITFDKMRDDTKAYIKIEGNYTFVTVRCWSDNNSWTLYGTYDYESYRDFNGLEIELKKGCGMVQINASKNIEPSEQIHVLLEEVLIDKRLNVIEKIANANNIVASVNMFNSIGAIGDSYTAGSAKHSDGTWSDVTNQSWVGTMAKRSGVSFSNYGLGGATTQSYIVDKLPNVLESEANDIYFLALGQNDANQKLTIGTLDDIHDDYTENANTFYGYYGKIISQVKNHAPKARFVMIKIHVSGDAYNDYNTAIAAIAEHYGFPCIDPFDDWFFTSSLYRNYRPDNHPTALGYSMMGIAMERLFSKCVVENMDYFLYSTIG